MHAVQGPTKKLRLQLLTVVVDYQILVRLAFINYPNKNNL